MSTPAHPSAGLMTPNLAEDLEPLLAGFIRAHERLLELFGLHREAIRTANHKQMRQVVGEEEQVTSRIAELERRRQEMLGVDPRHPTRGPTLTTLAKTLPAEQRDRLVPMAEHLRTLILQVKSAQHAIAIASGSLMNHLKGLMGQMNAKLSHAGVYGRTGRVESKQQVVSGIDLKS